MSRPHDRGGWSDSGPIDRSDHQMLDWEMRVDGLMGILRASGVVTTDEMRRAIESIDTVTYESLRYYERWLFAAELLLVEKGIVSVEEIDERVRSLGYRDWEATDVQEG